MKATQSTSINMIEDIIFATSYILIFMYFEMRTPHWGVSSRAIAMYVSRGDSVDSLSAIKKRDMRGVSKMLNKIDLGGRLTRDPELRYTPSGIAVCNFTLAVDRNFKNAQGERETDFIPHKAYRQKAELIANSLTKGSLVNTTGRLQIRSYTDKDGQRRWVTEVVVEDIYFMEPKGAHGEQTQSEEPGYSNWGNEINLDDDIPF